MEKNKEYLELSKMSMQELRQELLSLRRQEAELKPKTYKPNNSKDL